MDDVPRKRPQADGLQSHALASISPSKRSRSEKSSHIGTNHGRRQHLSTARSARKVLAASTSDSDDDDDFTSSSGSSLSSSDDDDEIESDSERDKEENQRGDVTGVSSADPEETTDKTASLPCISARGKPRIHRVEKPDLLSKLSAFLPQIKGANEDLQREIAAGREKDIRLDDEDEDHGNGQYIEMNLGLGVLEEKRSGDEQESSDEDVNGHEPAQGTNVLDRLMGKKPDSSEKPSIHEIAD